MADGLTKRPAEVPANVTLEHPSGTIDVLVDYRMDNGFEVVSAGLLRTARKLAEGKLFVPSDVWSGMDR